VEGDSTVGVIYDAERGGGVPDTWYFSLACGDPLTGRGVELAVSTNDRLLMGYARAEIIFDNLKIAVQQVYEVLLPIIRK